MKIIGFHSKGVTTILSPYMYFGVLFQERLPGTGLVSAESIDDIVDFDYAILHKENKSSVILFPPGCKPDGWSWYQLLNVLTATNMLPSKDPNEIKEIYL